MIRASLTALSLCTCLMAAPVFGASHDTNAPGGPIQGLDYDPRTGAFTEPPPPEGGWQAFADLLQKATPSVNTAIPLSPSQVTDHIAALIDAGHAQEALDLIQKREAARARSGAIGTDVQLEYQRGRALAALGQHGQAIAVWQKMTQEYPELPEPWNALAIEYARQGHLQQARDALDMALVSDPHFAPALENLGHVQMMLARESFDRARAARGQSGGAGTRAEPLPGDKHPAPAAQ